MIIMQGLPASGKSTKAKELVESMGNAVRINKDLLRTMLHFDKFNGKNEGKTRDVARTIAHACLSKQINVIIDDTNLNEGTVQGWKDLAKTYGATIEYQKIDTPVGECIERDYLRGVKGERAVGKAVVQRMALQYKDYLKGEEVIVCDLDGTLCDCDHRRTFLEGEKKDWKGFFGNMHLDTLRMDVVDKLNKYLTSKSGMPLIFVSARPENYREVTEKWLKDNFYYNYTALLMREANDSRPDTEVKSEIYEKYLKNLKIIKVFDDRPSVIRMWREKGLDVEDVGKGVEF